MNKHGRKDKRGRYNATAMSGAPKIMVGPVQSGHIFEGGEATARPMSATVVTQEVSKLVFLLEGL